MLMRRRNEAMQRNRANLVRTSSIIYLLVLACCQPSTAFFFSSKETTEEDASINNDNEDGSSNTTMTNQCTGLALDSSRLVVVVDDNEELLDRIRMMSQQSTASSKQRRGRNKDGLTVIQKRDVALSSTQQYSRSSDSSDNLSNYGHSDGSISTIRLQATYHGIKVHGADIVVTTVTAESGECHKNPANSNNHSDEQHSCYRFQTTTRIHGKVFQNISLSSDQILLSSSLLVAPQELPTVTAAASAAALDEARQAISAHFGVHIQDVGSDISLEIFPTVQGDYLAYFGDVLVSQPQPAGTGTQLLEVVVDATSMSILSKCLVGGFNDGISSSSSLSTITTTPVSHRSLRPNRIVDRAPTRTVATITGETNNISMRCDSCPESSHKEIMWPSNNATDDINCSLQSLYLNNTEKKVPCISGVDSKGIQVFGPGPNHRLFWRGTYDCHSSTNTGQCDLVPFSEGCNDAMSDVQFVATKTMQFLEDHLGVLSGDFLIRDPKPIRALVHYGTQYCNALFRGREDTLYFGDCDCKGAGAMVSLDIIAHEISHFLTWHSSHLGSGYESGGLSEGYGDILGTMMEFVINDDFDEPDFTIGESTGVVMRSMEDPSTSFGGLESVCNFDVRNNTSVHATSGPLNKAFVLSVRACETGGCATSTTECVVLLGSIFQYSNLHKLSMYSGYLDAATASCESVNDFFLERAPNTTCSVTDMYTYIENGWSGVNVVFEGSIDQCRARKQCLGGESQSLGTRAFLTITGILDRVVQMKRSMLHFPQ